MHLLLYCVFIIIFLRSIRFNNNNDRKEVIFSKTQSEIMKVFFAFLIILGHLSTRSNDSVLLLFEKLMVFAVGMFFLFSGYGLASSLLSNKELFYHKKIYRYLKIIVPTLLSIVVILCINKFDFNFHLLINWYIVELLILYTFFYLAFWKFESNKALKTLCLLCFVLIMFFIINGFHKSWFLDTLCFPLGVFFKLKEKKIIYYINLRYKVCILTTIVIFLVSSVLSIYIVNEKLFFVFLLKIISILCFCFLNAIFMQKFSLQNTIVEKFNNFSFELYLYHIPLLTTLYFIIDKYGFIQYQIYVILLTIILAYIMHFIDTKILFYLGGKYVNENN